MKRSAILPVLIIAAFAAYFGLFSSFAPYICDDNRFFRDYLFYNNWQSGLSLRGLWLFLVKMYEVDNCRFDNIIYMALRAFDAHWVTTMAATIFSAWFMAEVEHLYRGRWRPMLLLAMIIVVLFPWRQSEITSCNFFNLMLPAAVTLAFVRLVASPRRFSPWLWPFAVLFAIFAGGIHEGFSVPVSVGMILLLARQKFRAAPSQWILGAAYALGILFVITTPGMWSRFGEHSGFIAGLKFLLTITMAISVPGACFAAALFTPAGRRAARSILSSPSLLIILGALPMTLAVAFILEPNNVRPMWIASLFFNLAGISILAPILPRIPRPVWIAAAVLTATFGANVIRNQRKEWIIHNHLWQHMFSAPHGTVFFDYDPTHPPFTLLQVAKNEWSDELSMLALNFNRPHGKIYCVVPAELAHITAAQARAINSRTNPGPEFSPVPGTDGWVQWRNQILAPDTLIATTHWTGEREIHAMFPISLDVTLPTGQQIENLNFVRQKFVTTSGDTLTHISTTRRGIRPPFPAIRIRSQLPSTW